MPKKICPKCKAKLVKRTGKHGEFWGCPNYPKCNGSESIEVKPCFNYVPEELLYEVM